MAWGPSPATKEGTQQGAALGSERAGHQGAALGSERAGHLPLPSFIQGVYCCSNTSYHTRNVATASSHFSPVIAYLKLHGTHLSLAVR